MNSKKSDKVLENKNIKKCSIKNKKIFMIVGGISAIYFIIFVVYAVVNLSSPQKTTETDNDPATQETIQEEEVKDPEQEKNEYITSCITVPYNDLARNPNQYKGSKVTFTGEVIQVANGWGNNVTLRINVTQDEYGFWDDTIYAEYKYHDENESKILEDDIVTIYGDFMGEKDYTSIFGQTITIPSIEIKYLNIN